MNFISFINKHLSSRRTWGTIVVGLSFFIALPSVPSIEGAPIHNTMLFWGSLCFLVGSLLNAKELPHAKALLFAGIRLVWFIVFMLCLYERVRLQS